jgi:hypothetical protein
VTETNWVHLIPNLGWMLWVFTAVLALLAIFYRRVPSSKLKEFIHWLGERSFGFAVVLVAFVFVVVYTDLRRQPIGFNAEWPDAIRCSYRLPNAAYATPMIWYYRGISSNRSSLGDVATFFLVGAFNGRLPKTGDNPEIGYIPQIIWFDKTHTLIDPWRQPEKYGPAFSENLSGNGDNLMYKLGLFKDLDCDGRHSSTTEKSDQTIDGIRRAGNAFIFARTF